VQSRYPWADNGSDVSAFLGLGNGEVVGRLQIEPNPGRRAEIGGKAQGGVGCLPATTSAMRLRGTSSARDSVSWQVTSLTESDNRCLSLDSPVDLLYIPSTHMSRVLTSRRIRLIFIMLRRPNP